MLINYNKTERMIIYATLSIKYSRWVSLSHIWEQQPDLYRLQGALLETWHTVNRSDVYPCSRTKTSSYNCLVQTLQSSDTSLKYWRAHRLWHFILLWRTPCCTPCCLTNYIIFGLKLTYLLYSFKLSLRKLKHLTWKNPSKYCVCSRYCWQMSDQNIFHIQ